MLLQGYLTSNIISRSSLQWPGFTLSCVGAAVVDWFSAWLAEQGVQGSSPDFDTWISEIWYILLSSRIDWKIVKAT